MQRNSRRQQAVMGVEMIHKLLAMLVVLLVAGPAMADTAPSYTRYGDGILYKMCDAEDTAGPGPCQNASGTEVIVVNAASFDSVTFYAMQSAAGTFTCDVFSRDAPYDTAAAGNGSQVNLTSLSASAESLTLVGPFVWLWLECTLGTSAQATVTMFGRVNK